MTGEGRESSKEEKELEMKRGETRDVKAVKEKKRRYG